MGQVQAGGDIRVSVGDWNALGKAATTVRFAVFVREQGIDPRIELDARDTAAVHAVAFDAGGAPVATGRLLPDAHIGRMAVLPAARGRGIGALILRSLVGVAAAMGMRQLQLHSQRSAVGFYAREGFVAIGPEYEEAGIPHQTMTRSIEPAGPPA